MRPFAWIGPRLVHQGHLERLCPEAIALYLVLVTVAEVQGLSYYGTERICRLLSLAPPALARARNALVGAGLVAFEAPLYQVLALDPPRMRETLMRMGSGHDAAGRVIPRQNTPPEGDSECPPDMTRKAIEPPTAS